MEGHTYEAYKVFDLSYSGDNYAYSVTEEFKAFFRAKAGNEDVSTDVRLNKFATDYIRDNDIDQVAKELNAYIKKNNIENSGSNGEVKVNEGIETTSISNLSIGYYVVTDKVGGNTSVVSATILGNTDKDLVINLKAEAPTISKEIKKGDSWGNVGDSQIGQLVEYRLISTIPSVQGYDTYKYKIRDTMSAGLDFNKDSLKVYVGEKDNGGTLLDNSYYSLNTEKENVTFELSVDIIEGINDGKFAKGDKLYIYYNATLNENAQIAGGSNDNSVELEYSNNPYEETTTTTTPTTSVKAYTFRLNGLKTNETGGALEGAEFQITRDKEPLVFIPSTRTDSNGDEIRVYTISNSPKIVGNNYTDTIVSPVSGKFEVIGLDADVEYTLVETKAPEGYNKIDPIVFTITAEYNGEGTITNIGTNNSGISKIGETFELGTTIVNTEIGSLLPQTGGKGTKIFTIVGGVIMVVAAFVFIRMRKTA